ncbi:MAG: hypothetical protein AAF244_00030 [Pseudomonadota bacterium]
MSELLPSYAKASELKEVAPYNIPEMVAGEIVATSSYRVGKFEHIVAQVKLDDEMGMAGMIITYDNHGIVGRRVRGRLFKDLEDRKDVFAHGVSGFDAAYYFMSEFPDQDFFDFRTQHLSADDPSLMESRNFMAESMFVFGKTRYHEYYLEHGYPNIPYQPTVNAKTSVTKALIGRVLRLGFGS